MRGLRGERGSGAVLALTIALAVLAVSLAVVALGGAAALRQRVIAAADSAALAAADTALGAAPGSPCANAERIAAAHGASLVRCELDGLVVTVEATASFAGIPVRARARAGPSPDGGVSG
jgi:secretion/DNA translocation related TadE-like protein